MVVRVNLGSGSKLSRALWLHFLFDLIAVHLLGSLEILNLVEEI